MNKDEKFFHFATNNYMYGLPARNEKRKFLEITIFNGHAKNVERGLSDAITISVNKQTIKPNKSKQYFENIRITNRWLWGFTDDHLTKKQKKFLKIIGATSSEMKFRSGRCDANGFICGDWTTFNGRADSFCIRSKSLGDSISVYDVTTMGQFIDVADLIVFGHVSKPLNPVERYRPGLKKQTAIME